MDAQEALDAMAPRMVPVVWVCENGVIVQPEYAYSVEAEIIDAAAEAMNVRMMNPDSVITLLLGEIPEGSQ